MKARTSTAVLAAFCGALALICACSKQQQPAAPLKVLVLIPQTGPAAEYARYSKMGFDLGIKRAEAEGVPITVKFVDTKSNPTEATTALQQNLLTDTPDAVIPMLSSVTKAVTPVLRERGLVSIANAVAAPGLANPSEGRFRMFPTSEEVSELAASALKDAGAKSTLIVYVNDEYGLGCLATFTAKATEALVNVVASEPFTPVEKDFRNQWVRLLALNPDSIFVTGYGPGYVAVLLQLAETKYPGLVVTDFTLTAPSVFRAVSGVKEGTLIIAPATKPEFEQEATKTFPDAGYFVNVGTAYDAIVGLASAHRESVGKQMSLSQRLAGVKVEGGAFGLIRFNDKGDEVIPMAVYEVRQGKIVRR